MNGPQDLGGQAGFGAVVPEVDEPVFHAAWERRVLAMNLSAAGMGHWSIDEIRHARESLHPADYYGSSYYEIWLAALEGLLLRHGFVTAEELAAGRKLENGTTPKRVLGAADVAGVLSRGSPYARTPQGSATFAPGDHVRTVNMHPSGHTRLPRYARGRLGTIESVNGVHVFPDSNAHGDGEAPQWLYTVVFEATEIWGRDADPRQRLSIDAWEGYLEPA